MKTLSAIAILCASATIASAQDQGVAPALAQDAGWPPEAPERWGLAVIDVETTGLRPGHHEMIDIGVIYTDLDGGELGRFFTRIQPDHPQRLSPGAFAVNAFDPERWDELGALAEPEAARALRAFHAEHAGARTMLLTGYNAWFDAAFLRAFLAEEGHDWREDYHYFVLDLPSMAWGQGLTALSGGQLAGALDLTPETAIPEDHTGITGAQFNLDVYRALIARQAQPSSTPSQP